MAITYLDGRRYGRALVSGAEWVRHTRAHLNQINVFPVPDGDTGTNMALSLAAAAAAVANSDDRDLATVSRRAAEASVLGAKGNSGLILAHWFLGLAEAFGERSRIGVKELSEALASATHAVYAALERPVEGTILSVMRAVSNRVQRESAQVGDLAGLAARMVAEGEVALAHTQEQLAVLREAHVVDAGAQGYVNFLKGVLRALRGERTPRAAAHAAADAPPAVDRAEIAVGPERYCTEIVVRGKRFNAAKIRRRLEPLGSSFLLATAGSSLKVHIHTNHPDEVLRYAAKLGEIVERKVEDMQRQAASEQRGEIPPLVPIDQQPETVAVVCDSTADLEPALRRELGIELVPLQVMFGDEVFRDQVDISTEEFYRRLLSDERHPTTSQPPPAEFVGALERVRRDRQVLILTLSGELSGTFRSAEHGIRLSDHPRVELFDSGSASLGLGLMAVSAARLAARGADLDTVTLWLKRWREDSGLVFSLATLDYLRRGGRIGAARSLIGKILGFQPILGFEGGEVIPLAKSRGPDDAFAKVTELLAERLPEGTRVRLGMIEIGNAPALDRLSAWLRDRCRVLETIRTTPSGVIGAHAGPQAWGLFYQRVRDDDPLLA